MRPFAKRALSIFGLSLFVAILGFQAAPAVPNMILYYKFDETAGNTAFDSSGNGYNGTWAAPNGSTLAASTDVGMAPAVPGNVRSLLFGKPAGIPPPKYGAQVTAPDNPAFSFTGPFTAMAWVNPAALAVGENANDRGCIVHHWDYSTMQLSGWSFEREQDGRVSFTTGSRTATNVLTGTVTLPVGDWHHVAVVYTGPPATPGANNKFIYIDGNPTPNAAGSTTIVPADSTNPLTIGKDDYTRNFYGNIDEVRLFDGALTPAQITQCYQGVHAPLNLVATAGPDEAVLTWTASATAQNYDVYKSTTQGGPYSWLANVTPGSTTTYVDQNAPAGTRVYYVLKSRVGTLASAYSNEAFCDPRVAVIIINPKAVSVAEAGGTATFTVTLLIRPNNTSVVVRVTSSDPTAVGVHGPAGGPPASFVDLTYLPNQPLTQTVTVTGIERNVQGPDLTVPLTFTVTSSDTNYPPASAPRAIPCTVIQDRPGLVINPPSGLATTNGGPAITFTVALATQTIGGPANFTFSVSDPNVATVTASANTLSTAPNPSITVTVTPLLVDTQTTYIAPYQILIDTSTSGDPGYAALGTTRVQIFTDTSTPPLEHLWKCGLLGLDGLLPLGLLALWRRRRQARKST